MPSLSRRRLRLWAAGLFAVGLVQIHNAAASKFYDLSEFWTAGSLAGTRALGNHAQYVRWQSTHGVERGTFPYPPGFAFLYVPFAHVPLAVAYGLQVALMLALAACAALLLGRIYRVPPELALLATYAWAPLTASVLLGQNSIVALLLCCAFIEGLQRDDDRIAGLAAGFLLYKPPYAAPFILLLLVRRRPRALGVVALVAAGWYALSAAATQDWGWPGPWLHALARYAAPDFAFNAPVAIALPGLLQRAHFPALAADAVGALIALVGTWRARRFTAAAAGAAAAAFAVALGPHVWAYDATLLLPTIFYTLSALAEPLRTRAIVAAYLLAPAWLLSHEIGFDFLALVALAALGFWFVQPTSDFVRKASTSRSSISW